MPDVKTIAVTGADGFVGARLCEVLEARGFCVLRLVRRATGAGEARRVVDLLTEGDLGPYLVGADAVIHLAGRAHVIRESHQDPESAFEQLNVQATMRLAEAAARVGVRRFVFVSSIGVNGNRTHGAPFTESDPPAPVEIYARSKLRAEEALRSMCPVAGIELVVVRPTLVYGPEAKGNFRRLMRLASSGWPLPIGSIRNRRNLIGRENLVDFLCLCAMHPAAAGNLFLVAEPEAHSTPGLVKHLARAQHRPCRIFPVPVVALRMAASVFGLRGEFDKLCGSLEVSARRAQELLAWQPKVTFEEEIQKSVDATRKKSPNG
jgi:nucleoside-diphosphate-sugar epimerase